MEININNYEVYIIDYLDGNLGTLETAQLFLFLENHPGLKEEFEDLKTITLKTSNDERFGFNESLKQPADIDAVNLSMLNYTHYFIAALEGDLSPTGFQLLNKFLTEHQELLSEYNLFKSTKLIPENTVKYPERRLLQRKHKKVFMQYYFATGIAATLLLLLTVYLNLNPGTDSDLDKNLEYSIQHQMDNDKVKLTENEVKEPETTINDKNTKPEKGIKETQPAKAKSKKNEIPKARVTKEPVRPIRKIEKRGMVTNNTSIIAENQTRNFYSGIYDDIRLSQELTLAEKEESEFVAEKQQERLGSIKARRLLNSVIESGEQLSKQLPESLNGWLFADMGVKGFNLLTNNQYTIDRRFNQNGNLESLKIKNKEEKL